MPPRWASRTGHVGAALALLATGSAFAQPLPSMAGAWRVTTAPHHDSGCVISGDAVATRTGAGRYDVLLNVVETCPDGTKFTATERCPALVTAERVTMACVVLRMGELGYLADTFALEWRGPDLVGRLVDSGHWNEPVTWRRAAPALTS